MGRTKLDPVAEALLKLENWTALETASGSATHVPDALRQLMHSTDEASAKMAYWKLDNDVCVNYHLYSSAPAIVAPMIVALASMEVTPFALRYALDLLVQLAYGESDIPRPRRQSAQQLRDATRGRLRCGLYFYYTHLNSSDERVQRAAAELIFDLDLDTDGARRTIHSIVDRDGSDPFWIRWQLQ